MLMLPEAEACWDRWKLPPPPPEPMLLEPVPGGSSASSRLRLLRPERPAAAILLLLLLEVALEMVTRDDGLGDSFNLAGTWGD